MKHNESFGICFIGIDVKGFKLMILFTLGSITIEAKGTFLKNIIKNHTGQNFDLVMISLYKKNYPIIIRTALYLTSLAIGSVVTEKCEL